MIGVVTGLRSEARCLPPAADRLVVCSGSDPKRARQLAGELIAQGARRFLSFGLAGGLIPGLHPGDLVLPEAVVLPGGEHVRADASWRGQLKVRLYASGPRVHEGLLAGSDRLVAAAAEKLHLRATTGALAVDMESHAVAAAARDAGRPFVVVRAVADLAEQTLPDAALVAIGPQGAVRPLEVAKILFARPEEIWPLLRLGRQSARAHATLRRVALLADAALGPG